MKSKCFIINIPSMPMWLFHIGQSMSSWLWKHQSDCATQCHCRKRTSPIGNSPPFPISMTTITFRPVIYQLEERERKSSRWELCNNVQLCWRIRRPFITLRQRGDKDIFHSLRDLMRLLTIHHLNAAQQRTEFSREFRQKLTGFSREFQRSANETAARATWWC